MQGEQLVLKGGSDCNSEEILQKAEDHYKTLQIDKQDTSRNLNNIHIPLEAAFVKLPSDNNVKAHQATSTLPSHKPTDFMETLMAKDKPSHKLESSNENHPDKDSSHKYPSSWSDLCAMLRNLYAGRAFLLSSMVLPTVCMVWFICAGINLDSSLYLPPT